MFGEIFGHTLGELAEETGVTAVGEPTPIAVLCDGVARCWEIVFRIEPAEADRDRAPTTAEYSELAWRSMAELPENLTPTAVQMMPLVEALSAPTARGAR